jgi:septal ring factor EnvC (AmiA/AmiB activator)
MITITLPKDEYDKTQNDIKELKEKIAKILEEKGSFILRDTRWYPFGPTNTNFYIYNFTTEEKETFLTKEITALNTKINTISLDRDAYYKENLKSNQLAGSRLKMIESLQETITQLQTKQKDLEVKHKEEIKALKVSFELEEIKSRPWWKLF